MYLNINDKLTVLLRNRRQIILATKQSALDFLDLEQSAYKALVMKQSEIVV